MVPRPLIECVPNLSEGRDQQTIQALANVIETHPGVALLHVDSDADHHRTVITFAGAPASVGEAAFQLTKAAVEQIDLTQHQGVHPRMGALDVLPFVPLDSATMDDCVRLAHQVGERIGQELNLPVYLYESAATRPERQNLASVRKGQFEHFSEKIQHPDWLPDYGPAELHPTAGAIAVGARPVLIAFNVNLNTDDPAIARKIAKRIRHSGGGLPHVKALGFPLAQQGKVQVSMNMTDYRITSLFQVFDQIAQMAGQFGITVAESEIVGLAPQQALLDTATTLLKLASFDPAQILESQIERAFADE